MLEELIGQTLRKALLHPVTGKVLLPAGTVLTAPYMDRLERQGLQDLVVECLDRPTGDAGLGLTGAKDLDDFEIEIPDLPDILGEFMAPPTPPPAPAAAPAGAPAWMPVPGAAPQPGWVPVPGQGGPAPQAPAAYPHAPAPGWAPPYGQQAIVPPPPPPAPPKAPEPPPARQPGAHGAMQAPLVASGPMRYYHNPGHLMPERNIMAAMQAVALVEENLKAGQLPAFEPLRRVVDEVIERMGAHRDKLQDGIELRVTNQPHDQSHPINVFMISVATGLAMNYSPDDLRTLGLAALCHDIGKTAIPKEILNKVGPLTPHDIDMLRAHTLMGKRILEKVGWASPLMARVVYEHHERNDGTGYPLRLTEHQIHEMSKIVAVAEVYDALISDTSYRARYSPELGYNSIRIGDRSGLDARVIKAFQRFVVPYPLNSFVMLDTKEIGQVVAVNRQNVYKPVIKIGAETVDLAAQAKRTIVTSHFQAF